jgi:biopolymer transport protein ExbD
MKFEKKRATAKQEIPTASLPDIVFMLLLFFLVSSTLREVEVLVSFRLPDAEAIEKIENKRLVSYIWVGNDGRIQINDNIVKVNQIKDIMYKRRENVPATIVSLRVDRGSNMGIITDIQQELRKAYCLRLNYSASLKL